MSPPQCTPASPATPSSSAASPASSRTSEDATPRALHFPYTPSGRNFSGDSEVAPMKYLIVTGGTISGLGKGTAISSIGVVLKSRGIRCTAIKIDPYLNVDAGTMSPLEHGEVYVTEDGGEADLDLGNYERFLGLTLTSRHSMTSGKIYQQVIARERQGDYLGKTVQMVPHVSDAIQDWIEDVATTPVDASGRRPDVCLVELGGTVGDIESAIYSEALQQLQFKVGGENFLMVHVGFVATVGSGEQKTKPCQFSVKQLRQAGISPDLLLCRCEAPVEAATRTKLSLFCQMSPEHVISMHDISNVYRVPLLLQEQKVDQLIMEHFGYGCVEVCPTVPIKHLPSEVRAEPLGDWRIIADRADACNAEVSIAIVGKYTGLADAYTSVIKALKHAAIEAGARLEIIWVESSELEPNTQQSEPNRYKAAWAKLNLASGVLVPGGFGDRGIEGKILAANYCRTNAKPYFGICVGMQTAVIEFARNVVGWEQANSTEFNESTPQPVVIFMPESSTTVMGGTMRLGSRATIMKDGDSLGRKLYAGKPVVYERHRHRYEVKASCVPAMEAKGLRFSGTDDKNQRMEICEIEGHPFFFACQYHPEYTSRPARASPPFLGLVLAAMGQLEARMKQDGGVLKTGAGFSAPIKMGKQV